PAPHLSRGFSFPSATLGFGRLVRPFHLVLSFQTLAFPPDQRDFHPPNCSASPLRTLARSFPVRNEAGEFYRIAGVCEDITERKESEAALRASEERLRLITETIDEVFWMAGVAVETMVYVSPAYERIWGRS